MKIKIKTKNNLLLKNGFTLVELLIVLAIAAIMTGVLFSSSNDTKRADADADAASRIVVAQLRLLQNEAVNGKQVTESGNDYNICRARMIKAAADATSFNVDYCYQCGPTPIPDCPTSIALSTVNLSKFNVAFVSMASDVAFKVPTGEMNQVDVKILIKSLKNPAVLRTVCACKFGSIREEKGDLADCVSVCR